MRNFSLAILITMILTVFVRPLFSSSEDTHGRIMFAKGVRNGCQQVLLDRMPKEDPTTIGVYCEKLYWETLKAWDDARSKDQQ